MSALVAVLAIACLVLAVALTMSIRANRKWVALNEQIMGLKSGQTVTVESPWWEAGERRLKLWKIP